MNPDPERPNHCRFLLREAKSWYAEKGYIPYQLAAALREFGYTKPELELQFSLGAQA